MLLLAIQNIGIFLEHSPNHQKSLDAEDIKRLVDVLDSSVPHDLKEEILWVFTSLVEEDG